MIDKKKELKFDKEKCLFYIEDYRNFEDFITKNYISREDVEEILEQNKDNMTGFYDYDGIAETVINLLNKK